MTLFKQALAYQVIPILILLLWAVPGRSDVIASDSLMGQHHLVLKKLKHSVFAEPLYVRSDERGSQLSAEVYGLLELPLEGLAAILQRPANWCEFIPLTPNVKACTYHQTTANSQLTFYVGKKEYATPDDAHQFNYDYRIIENRDDYFKIVLTAKSGPLRTSNYHIQVEGVALERQSLVRVRMGFNSSWASRVLTSTYLATFGRHKVGFSQVGMDKDNKPIYVRGVQGIVERNVMRYYLALMSFLDTNDLPTWRRFDANLRTWFNRIEVYHTQLHELERDEYLEIKRKERINQLKYQKALQTRWDQAEHAS